MSSGTSACAKWENSDPTELKIVLIGGRCDGNPSGKSSVGNIILGKDVFDINRRAAKSVVRQGLVSGRQVIVVNTPAWKSAYPLDLTPKLTQLEIQQSVYGCPPRPHVFVLVMPLDNTHVGTGPGMSAEEHVRFFLGDRVWRHTIVVFTVTDRDKMKPVRDLIRSDDNLSCLRQLTQECEDRFHVLNISDREDISQVTGLLEKIDQTMTSNGCHYETEKHISEELKEVERTIRKRAEQRRSDVQKQTTRLPKGLTDLRILLMGRSFSGKSSAGNTILGGSVFKTNQRSAHCEVRYGEVAGRRLAVVDSPGWYYNSPLQDTSEMDKLEIQNSVRVCPPRPHAIVLIVPVDEAFTKEQKVAVEEHMTLLTQNVWSHSIVLFTSGDWLGDRSIEQHIEAEGEDLRWLVDKCGNRYHVFNNEKKDDTQVTELLEKIEEMVAENIGGHYEVEADVSEKFSERKKSIEEHIQTLTTRTHRQGTALKALFEGERQSLSDVRVMVVGGDQSGRSTAGNHILQETVFTGHKYKEFKTQTKARIECIRQQRQVAERNVSVVNCPDWSTTPPSQKIKDVLLHGLTLCFPGPHAALLNVSVRSSFSEADRRSVEEHMKLLGDRIWKHTLVLFTKGWWLGERRVEEYIESEGEPLTWLLEKCGYRYHVLQFSDWYIPEVTELMEKIEDMVTRNRGHFGPLVSREEMSVRDTGHFRVGHETRQKTRFERLKEKKTFTAEEWNRREEEWKKREEEWKRKEEEGRRREEEWRRREEEMIERMLEFVVTQPEQPTLPVRRNKRWNSKGGHPPSMSGGTPSETTSSYCCSPDNKVSDWLRTRYRSSGYASTTMSEASSQTDTDGTSVTSHTSTK